MNYYSLHNHTDFSNVRFLDSINRSSLMVEKAINLGMKGIAFTEHECLSGAVELLKLKDKIKETNPDFKIIFGNEIYLIDESNIKQNPKYYHFILIAKDLQGWHQLKELSSRAWGRAYTERGMMRVPTTYQDIEEIVGQDKGHIIASTACLGGELDYSILAHNVARANSFIRWCIDIFGKENFNIELQVSDSDEQTRCNKVLISLANHYELPYIITTDSHYLDKDDFAIHSAFLNSKLADDRETEKFYKYTYIMSIEEMQEILLRTGLSLDEINKGIENTSLIGDRVEDFDFRHGTIVPNSKIPHFELSYRYLDDKYPSIKSFYESSDERDRYLMYLIEQGISNKNIEIDDQKLERIDVELSVINKVSDGLNQRVSSYFLLMKEVIDIAWNYSFVGAGRGSSAGFYINYLIDLIQVDPLKYNLPYWRFLNDVRFELPDIDTDLSPAQKANVMKALKDYYGEDNVLNCITFKTNSLKSSVLSAMRGLNYSNDEAQAICNIIPIDRGHVYTLTECIEGNDELDLKPVPEVINKIEKYPRLFETIKKIEGLRMNASIHASAVYIFNNGYIEHNSLMKAPNGTRVTAFSMEDTNALSGLKIDLLYTDAQDKLMKCMDLLLHDGIIEWQGSLRATYNKYLHPDKLDYTNPSMWSDAASGKIMNLFQYETQVGEVAIKKAKPTSVIELATINSAIRVQSEGEIQPIDRYIAFHNNIQLWYNEMINAGLDDLEIEIMKDHLGNTYGNSLQQEDFMQLVMDPNIANFSLAESNKLRKVIAHKILADLIKQHDLFMEKCKENGCRDEFATYVWDYCIQPLARYSFSIIHAIVYSIVAVQEMNLATRFNPLYWTCACLCVNSGNSNADFDVESDDEEEMLEVAEEENTESTEIRRVAPNYGKIAKAIDDAQHRGVIIELPDINSAQMDFIPDRKNNSILYSLLAVNSVNDELYNQINANRPYTSIPDFLSKVDVTNLQMIGLIKAGCFDNLYEYNRIIIMKKYLDLVARNTYPIKDKITGAHINKILNLGMNLEGYESEIKIFKFKKYLDQNCLDRSAHRYILKSDDEITLKFFKKEVEKLLNISKGEYTYLPDSSIALKQASFERVYKAVMAKLMDYLNTDQGKEEFAKFERNEFAQELYQKYCSGSVASWEMNTMSFYHEPHELLGVNHALYNARNFNELPEKAQDQSKPELCTLIGTVTNADNTKHIVSISTIYGIVNIKFFAGSYAQYNQKYSVIDKSGKKTVTDQSWFKRGTKIIAYGYRRENMFVSKSDRSSGYVRTVGLIESILPDGSMSIRYSRKKSI